MKAQILLAPSALMAAIAVVIPADAELPPLIPMQDFFRNPVEAGHDKFSYNLFHEVAGEPIPLDVLRKYGGSDRLNMTRLALNLSEYINGVSKRHGDLTEQLFPGFEVQAITNGIYSYLWTAEPFKNIFSSPVSSK